MLHASPYVSIYDTSTYTEISGVLPKALDNGGNYMRLSDDETEVSLFTGDSTTKSMLLKLENDVITYIRPYPIKNINDAIWKNKNIYVGRSASTYLQKYDATNLIASTYTSITQDIIYKTLGYAKEDIGINQTGAAVEIFY